MSDNPQLTGQDRLTVSSQPHEIASFIESIQREFHDHPREAIVEAMEQCRVEIAPSESRAKLTECVRARLREER